jgi:ABC-type nitrate/sulfonate/bicarbonate transport system substrate-binding protein
LSLAISALIASLLAGSAAAQTCSGPLRKVNVGVSVSPPNVVHTTAYVAKELGLFAKHCIDANIIQFDGGSSPAASVALTQGNTFATVSDVQVGRGMKVKQVWGLAPKAPQAYLVADGIKGFADLKGKRLSARPAAASAASTGASAARRWATPGSPSTTPSSSRRAPPAGWRG